MEILTPIIVFGIIALIMGIVLAAASKLFAVEKDPKIDEILENLSGANCGGCGYAGCSACAEAIAKGEAPVDACPGCSAESLENISKIMGIESSGKIPKIAVIKCMGTNENTGKEFNFDGTKSCSAVSALNGGDKLCKYACLGYGDCVEACHFDAMSVENGIAKVDEEICIGCGVCAKICPKGVIEILPKGTKSLVKCSSKDKGVNVKDKCSVGCIACRICEKNCPEQAITIIDNLAVIDYDKCTSCGICSVKCPKKIIKSE